MPAAQVLVALFASLAAGAQSTAAVETMRDQPDQPTVEEIISSASAARDRLFDRESRFRIAYVREVATELGPHGGEQRADFVLARNKDSWLTADRLLAPREDDVPGWETSFCANGHVLFWREYNRVCAIDKLSEGWNIYIGWSYFIWQGMSVQRAIAESEGIDFSSVEAESIYAPHVNHPFIPEFLESHPREYHVAPNPEDVEGALCWVVEWPGMDKIWVDLELGFAIRRRQYHWGPGKPMRYEIEQADFREVRPNLWLPFTQTVEKYAEIDRTDEELWGTVVNKSVYQVKEVAFGDDVHDDAVQIRLPAGTRVVDNIRNMQYTVAEDGAEPFEEALAQAKQARSPNRGRWLLVSLNVLLIAILLLMWLLRGRK